MPKRQDIDFSRLDYRALSNDQRARVLRHVMEQAHVQRSQTLWRMLVAMAAGFRRIAGGIAQWYGEYRWRRRRRSEAAALYAFNDHMLKDIGVARCEIDWVVEAGRRAA